MLTKEFQKEFLQMLKKEGKKCNYKSKGGDLYKKLQDAFVFTNISFWPKRTDYNFEIWLHVKKYIYDDIFWEIIGAQDNAKCAESLRKEGAFTSPSITLKKMYYLIDDSENLDIAKNIVEEVDCVFDDFLEKNSITEYIKNMDPNKVRNGTTLKAIAYIECGMLDEAKKYVDDAIRKGDSGGFYIGEKSFFELAKEYLRKR